jgi:hypothetical protein
MKKIVIFLLATFLGLTNVFAQKHYPISQFAPDTLEYLKRNFVEQKQYYIGKNFQTLWNVLKSDIEVKYIGVDSSCFYDKDKADGKYYAAGLVLHWLEIDELRRRYWENPKEETGILVEFEYPYSYYEFDFYEAEPSNEVKLNGVNQIIKDITIL